MFFRFLGALGKKKRAEGFKVDCLVEKTMWGGKEGIERNFIRGREN